jgi:hypothetical protein
VTVIFGRIPGLLNFPRLASAISAQQAIPGRVLPDIRNSVDNGEYCEFHWLHFTPDSDGDYTRFVSVCILRDDGLAGKSGPHTLFWITADEDHSGDQDFVKAILAKFGGQIGIGRDEDDNPKEWEQIARTDFSDWLSPLSDHWKARIRLVDNLGSKGMALVEMLGYTDRKLLEAVARSFDPLSGPEPWAANS